MIELLAAVALTTQVELGRSLFLDPSLSEPPGTSCGSCHDPAHGYAGNHGSTIGIGQGSRPGVYIRRNTPSVRYLGFIPSFSVTAPPDGGPPTAKGGIFWDGAADHLDQAVQRPFLNAGEMGNASAGRVMAKIAAAPYGADFYRQYPAAAGKAPETLAAAGTAIQAFLLSPEMQPFSSKFDDYLRGKAQLTAAESRGLELFEDLSEGGCAGCHTVAAGSSEPSRSLFTSYTFEAPGVPRNLQIPANADPNAFDLGLCGRTDRPEVQDPRLCGQFRTPSLRNVATRDYFMHNGVFASLRDVVAFYATRDTDPGRWYATGTKFDDVPPPFRAEMDTSTPPYGLQPGQQPVLSDEDIDAIVAFLKTLTDADWAPRN